MPDTIRTGLTFEQLLSNLAGDEKADPNLVAVITHFHERINALEQGSSELRRRTPSQTQVGFNEG